MLSPEKVRASVIDAVRINSFADAVEKGVYVLAALIAVGFLTFLIYFMTPKVFVFFIAFFLFLAMAKGLFVLMIK